MPLPVGPVVNTNSRKNVRRKRKPTNQKDKDNDKKALRDSIRVQLIVAGVSQHGLLAETTKRLHKMQQIGFEPDPEFLTRFPEMRLEPMKMLEKASNSPTRLEDYRPAASELHKLRKQMQEQLDMRRDMDERDPDVA